MATQKIPLNKFRSKYIDVNTVPELLYGTPDNVATIIVNAQITNTTGIEKSVSFWVQRDIGTYYLVYNFPVPAYDSRTLVSGRVVLQGRDGDQIVNPDYLWISANNPGLNLSLGWLETINNN